MHCYSQGYGGAGGGAGGAGEYDGLNSLEGSISRDGVVIYDFTAQSFDGRIYLAIDRGTKALTRWGTPLYWIIMIKMDDPSSPPSGYTRIGLAYDFGPYGATFEPSQTLTFTYNDDDVPAGFDEINLVVAMCNEATGKWEILGSIVDADKNTIRVYVSHFTAFTILASTVPAAFTVTDLTLSPAEADIGETVTITILVTNTGALAGSYEVTLEVDEAVAATEEVTLAGGASQKVTFTTVKDFAGTYIVDVNGLAGKFEVMAPTPTPTPTPAPAPTPTPPAPTPGVINWYLIGGIIAGATIIGVVIWLTLRRRSAG